MVRRCEAFESRKILDIINQAAQAYRGVIPLDCWQEPYMPRDELEEELDRGVEFWGYESGGELVGVMGLQDMGDVALLRHAYVKPEHQNRGIGGELLSALREQTELPLLVGTWADATWAISFYQKHGFRLVPLEEHGPQLKKYWTISDRQVESSVVLADNRWFEKQEGSHEGSGEGSDS